MHYYGVDVVWIHRFLNYGVDFVWIQLVSLLRCRFRIESARSFTTVSIPYGFRPILYYGADFVLFSPILYYGVDFIWFSPLLYYGIDFVLLPSDSLLQHRFRVDSVRFFAAGSIPY